MTNPLSSLNHGLSEELTMVKNASVTFGLDLFKDDANKKGTKRTKADG